MQIDPLLKIVFASLLNFVFTHASNVQIILVLIFFMWQY
jgi:hypothetical protein